MTNLIETLHISSIPQLKKDIINGLKEDTKDYINEKDVEW